MRDSQYVGYRQKRIIAFLKSVIGATQNLVVVTSMYKYTKWLKTMHNMQLYLIYMKLGYIVSNI